MDNKKHKVWVASFDIGKKNFSFVVEEFDVELLQATERIPKNQRYFKNGTTTPKFRPIIRNVCLNGKILLMDNVDLTKGCAKGKYLDPKVFLNMIDLLDKYRDYWNKCTAFVIEQQMSWGNRRNIMALKLGQHCYSYFIINYANWKTTMEFPAYYKTQVLGATKKLSKPERKKWSVEKAMSILTERGDIENLSKLSSRKKQDDMADCITQLQSWKYLVYVDKNL